MTNPTRRAASQKRITLAWRPAEWRKPAHNNSHRSWAQRACDRLKDLRNNWSISIVWCAGNLGEEDHRALITEEVEEYWEIRTAGVLDSELSETSFFQSQMQFDDSVESIADSDLEDGEFQKMLTSPFLKPRKLQKTRCIGRAGERGKCTIDSSRKRKFEVSLIWRSQSFRETRCNVFIWTGKPNVEFCVQKRWSVEFERISSWRW